MCVCVCESRIKSEGWQGRRKKEITPVSSTLTYIFDKMAALCSVPCKSYLRVRFLTFIVCICRFIYTRLFLL